MKNSRQIAIGLISLVALFTFINPAAAQTIDAFSGTIEKTEIVQGDRVMFTGSIHNFGDTNIFLNSFNVSFREKLGPTATRDPRTYNLSKIYLQEDRLFRPNDTITGTLNETVDFKPAHYNVSIYFGISNGTSTPASDWTVYYAIKDIPFEIKGVSGTIEWVRYFGYSLLALIIFVIVYYLYNKFR